METLARGARPWRPGNLQFAITNICNVKCDFCGFAVDRFDSKQRHSITLNEAKILLISWSGITSATWCL